MKFFFDTEFTGLHKDTTLISIGIVDSDGSKAFYAELTDYDVSQIDDWLRENVINNLLLTGKNDPYCNRVTDKNIIEQLTLPEIIDEVYLAKGPKAFVCRELTHWFNEFRDEDASMIVQMVSDVCHYDFVLFMDLFGGAMELPEWISPTCYDINQDIAVYDNTSPFAAFNLSREELARTFYYNPDMKHNALIDAIIIAYIYHKCNMLSGFHMDRSW